MGKKIRYRLLTGSLLEPIFQYTSKIQVGINPISDPRGTRIGKHWYQMAKNTKPRFKAQNFEANIEYDLRTSSSYMILHFVNGWQHGFYLKQVPDSSITQTHNMINRMIQFERACQGQEDQYEDQEA